ncbi:hypothetical protein L484_016059 [Morus notabilis]|uniref:Uncharacterized protein n=1 Tax=Morus notabilis TaxID=981085 RepID=W9RNV8_9ROSA|nr:hypothetical protein L484_016059 [Morus notabilis]
METEISSSGGREPGISSTAFSREHCRQVVSAEEERDAGDSALDDRFIRGENAMWSATGGTAALSYCRLQFSTNIVVAYNLLSFYFQEKVYGRSKFRREIHLCSPPLPLAATRAAIAGDVEFTGLCSHAQRKDFHLQHNVITAAQAPPSPRPPTTTSPSRMTPPHPTRSETSDPLDPFVILSNLGWNRAERHHKSENNQL